MLTARYHGNNPALVEAECILLASFDEDFFPLLDERCRANYKVDEDEDGENYSSSSLRIISRPTGRVWKVCRRVH
jgi:hypothetical protein